MGNSRVNHVFDEVAGTIMDLVRNQELSNKSARLILITLIAELQNEDWDTEYESLERFSHIPLIVEAFEFQDVVLEEDEEEDEEDEDDWDDEDEDEDEEDDVDVETKDENVETKE